MKIKHLFLAAVAVIAGLTSCSKDDSGSRKNGPSDLFIQISQIDTRADTDAASAGAVEFKDGYLFFTDNAADPVIHNYVRIATSTIAGTVSVEQLKTGKVIKGIHQNVRTVWVIGNVPDLDADGNPFDLEQVSKMSEVENILVDIKSQYDADFGVKNATLSGSGAIDFLDGTTHTHLPTGETYTAVAHFEVAPIIARLEVDKIQANNENPTQTGGEITDFTLEGIYINHFYYTNGMNAGGVARGAFYDFEQNYNLYGDGVTNGYQSAWKQYVYDIMSIAATPGGTPTYPAITPTNDTWAYNVFATLSDPHIVFHFENLKIDGTLRQNTATGTDGQAYLTVTGYRHSSTANPVNIEGGKIYKMANVYFTADDLGDRPEEKGGKFDLLVQIDLLPWTIVPVDPSFD